MKVQRQELNGMSAFDYCRAVVGTIEGNDEKLEVYRGDTLAYTITSIKWGAGHRLVETDKEGFRTKRYDPNRFKT